MTIVLNKEINLISLTMRLSTGLFIMFHRIVNEPKIHGALPKIYAIYHYHNTATGSRCTVISLIWNLRTGLAWE